MMKSFPAIVALFVIAAQSCGAAINLVSTNPDFAGGLAGWDLYGADKGRIKLAEKGAPGGGNCAVVPSGKCSISQGLVMQPNRVYRIEFQYLRSDPGSMGNLDFFFNVPKGLNGSAGRMEITFPHGPSDAPAGKWAQFREAFRTPGGARSGKVILSASGAGEIRFARVSITEIPSAPKDRPLLPTTDLSFLPKVRTQKPLFRELLSDQPGDYTVVAWTHNLNMKNLPDSLKPKFTEESWKQELDRAFREAGDVGMMYYYLPGHAQEAPEIFRKYGVKFEVSCEHSGVMGEAIRDGAELLNPIASSTSSVDRKASLVDPHYVEAAKRTLERNAQTFRGAPYVFAYLGKDEPSIGLPEGPTSSWGPFWKQAASEVRDGFGYGKYSIPAPGDPAYQNDISGRPYRWIAFNRWMAREYADSKAVLYKALHDIDPKARYSPCDYWFMSGFVPFDFALMAKASDLVECDPYASSGERIKGRGLYNHGFGPKFLSDITGKPVRSIVQAFDYAGYAMSPEELLEWVSQSLRAGADHISYYQMDNPKYNDPERWKMMMYISKTVTSLKRIQRPTDPEVAILYSSDTYRSQGASTHANELYTAYSLLGERAGSWFRFVDDDSLDRGEKSLRGYKAVYVPLGKYVRGSIASQLEQYVRNGGTIISGDPEILSNAPDGSDMSHLRERIFGVKVLGPKTRQSMTVLKSAWAGSAAGLTLPIYLPVGQGGWYSGNGVAIRPLGSDVQVLGRFQDGTPAITVHRYGQGRAIYFAANPFVPECLLQGQGWDRLFRAFQQRLGAKVDRPIWRFRIPEP